MQKSLIHVIEKNNLQFFLMWRSDENEEAMPFQRLWPFNWKKHRELMQKNTYFFSHRLCPFAKRKHWILHKNMPSWWTSIAFNQLFNSACYLSVCLTLYLYKLIWIGYLISAKRDNLPLSFIECKPFTMCGAFRLVI